MTTRTLDSEAILRLLEVRAAVADGRARKAREDAGLSQAEVGGCRWGTHCVSKGRGVAQTSRPCCAAVWAIAHFWSGERTQLRKRRCKLRQSRHATTTERTTQCSPTLTATIS